MSYDDLLAGRYLSSGQVYFVTTVTAGRVPIFDDFKSARCVICEMQQTHTAGLVSSLAWVLMPDHLHWLFQLGDFGALAQVMQRFKGRSARALNVMNPGNPRVWQNGYHDHALRKEEDVRGVPVTWQPIRCAPVWWLRLVTIRIGMRPGCSTGTSFGMMTHVGQTLVCHGRLKSTPQHVQTLCSWKALRRARNDES